MIKYGKECQNDSACKSKICEMTYTDTGDPIGRKCVLQKVKYGTKCNTNLNCPSNRCVILYNDDGVFKEKRCVVMKNQEPINTDLMGEDTPEFLKSGDKENKIKQEPMAMNPHMKALAYKNRGPIAKFIILFLDILLDVLIKIFDLVEIIFKAIFNTTWNFMTRGWKGPFGNLTERWKRKGLLKCYGTPKEYIMANRLMAILFPPFSVFIAKGLNGWQYILVCSFLTMLFYFPGMIYAFIVIEGTVPKDVICKK